MRAQRRLPEGAPPTATLPSVDPDYGTALPGDMKMRLARLPAFLSLLGVPGNLRWLKPAASSPGGRANECPINSLRLLHHDRDDLRDLVAALVLGRDAHEPAPLEVGQLELLLDESCLPGLGRPRELDDLGLGFEDDGHAILLCTASGAQRNPASVVRPPRDSDST